MVYFYLILLVVKLDFKSFWILIIMPVLPLIMYMIYKLSIYYLIRYILFYGQRLNSTSSISSSLSSSSTTTTFNFNSSIQGMELSPLGLTSSPLWTVNHSEIDTVDQSDNRESIAFDPGICQIAIKAYCFTIIIFKYIFNIICFIFSSISFLFKI